MRIAYGCPYRCRFCPGWVYSGGHWVPRDPQLIFDDICTIAEPFIYFYDENSFHDVASHDEALAQMLIAAGRQEAISRLRAGRQHRQASRAVSSFGRGPASRWCLSAWNRSTPARSWSGRRKSRPRPTRRPSTCWAEFGIEVSVGFMLKPDVTREDFQRIDDYIHDHPSILHVEFTPHDALPRHAAVSKSKKDEILTRDWQVYDMQHFVVKTVLPQEEIYRMIVRSYSKIVLADCPPKGMRLLFKQWGGWKYRMIRGLLANRAALARAPHDVLDSVEGGPLDN